jgi:hypothetical protein
LGLLTHHVDAVHYNEPALRKLGHMYYDAYCKSVQIENRKPQDKEYNLVINSRAGNRDIMFNCDAYFKPSTIYKNLPINMCMTHSMTFNTKTGSAYVGTFNIELIRFGPLITMRFEKKDFTTTVRSDVRSALNELIPADFRPKAQMSYILAGVFGSADENRMTVQMYIFNSGEIIFQKNYNDGNPSDEKFETATNYTIFGSTMTYMAL